MNNIRNVMHFLWLEARSSLFVFWGIILSIFTIALILVVSTNTTSVTVSGAGAVITYALVAGILTPKDALYFSLGLSVRRKDFFVAMSLFFVLLSAGLTVLNTLLFQIELFIAQRLEAPFTFFLLSMYKDMTLMNIVFLFLLILHQFMLGYLFISIFQRFGRIGLFLLGAIITLLVIVMGIFDLWSSLIPFLDRFQSIEQFLMFLFPALAIVYVIGIYGCTRRVTVHH